MSDTDKTKPPKRQRGSDKTARIPIKIQPRQEKLKKPAWLRVRSTNDPAIDQLKTILRQHQLHTVCEEASCPNLGECFSHGTATFMIMGDICTRRCPFCDVSHGRPEPLDPNEPQQLAETIQAMQLHYVVITSVDRDDLRDGGAQHFADCIQAIRNSSGNTQIEILVPDFRGRLEIAIDILSTAPADVFNHNLETVPRLYKQARPGADYRHSLQLLEQFKQHNPNVATKSGLMLGLGERDEEIIQVMEDLRQHHCERLTLGQYLQPGPHHLPVERYVPPETFAHLRQTAKAMGFSHVASGPLVRSSYHADLQASGEIIE